MRNDGASPTCPRTRSEIPAVIDRPALSVSSAPLLGPSTGLVQAGQGLRGADRGGRAPGTGRWPCARWRPPPRRRGDRAPLLDASLSPSRSTCRTSPRPAAPCATRHPPGHQRDSDVNSLCRPVRLQYRRYDSSAHLPIRRPASGRLTAPTACHTPPDSLRASRTSTVRVVAIIVFAFFAGIGFVGAVDPYGCTTRSRRISGPGRTSSTLRPAGGDGHLRPDRRDRAGALRRVQARGRHVRRDPADPPRRDDRGRGQDVLGERGLRPGRHRRGRPRLVRGDRPRRVDDHPAAGPRAPARRRPRPGPRPDVERKLKEIIQSIRVTQAFRGRGRQGSDHHRLPQPELLRQPDLRREGGLRVVLRQAVRPRTSPRRGRDHRRAARSRRRTTTSSATPSVCDVEVDEGEECPAGESR